MTTYSTTVSERVILAGLAPTYKWDVAKWDEFEWNSSSEDLPLTVIKGISENLTLTDSLDRLLTKVIREGVSLDDPLFKQVTKGLSEALNVDDALIKLFKRR